MITTCTSRKAGDARRGSPSTRCPGWKRRRTTPIPAERLYIGEQHRRLMAGVDELRSASRRSTVWVISAKAGLVSGEDANSTPTTTSFAGLPADELRRRADQLGIAARRSASSPRGPAALTLVLAGNDYFDAASLDEPVAVGRPRRSRS